MRMKILAFIVFLLVLPLLISTNAKTDVGKNVQHNVIFEEVLYNFGMESFTYNSAGIGTSGYFYNIETFVEIGMTTVDLKTDEVIYEDMEVPLITQNLGNQISGLEKNSAIIITGTGTYEQLPINYLGSDVQMGKSKNTISQSELKQWRSSIAPRGVIIDKI